MPQTRQARRGIILFKPAVGNLGCLIFDNIINYFKTLDMLHFEDISAIECMNLSEIDLSDRCFCFRFFSEPPHIFIDSVKRFGILYPPVVRAKGDSYQIVDGFRRIEAANVCGIDTIHCRRCKGSLTDADLFFPALSIFLSSGQPHIADQAAILYRASKLLANDIIIDVILPILGYPSSPKVLARLLPLAEMDKELGSALIGEKINHDMALSLMELDPQERKQLVSLFLYYNYSQSKQREIFEHLKDICKKENRSLKDVLPELGWEGDMEDISSYETPLNLRLKKENENRLFRHSGEGWNPGFSNETPMNLRFTKGDENAQKGFSGENKVASGEAFRQRLKERRFPTLTGLENEWKKRIKSLRLPPSISLKPPPYFEGGKYRLSLSFKDIKGFREEMAKLDALEKDDAWIKLFTK
ncbi:ParB N-terminal domain-containing protein [bacterium]|nr:ParB N-terminal domain-containing protein [bacterium]